MPQTCTICRHPERDAINAALVQNERYRRIAARTGTTPASLRRHKVGHLPLSLTKAVHVAEVLQAESMAGLIVMLQREALDMMAKAKATGDFRTALFAMVQVRANAELLERCTEKDREQEKLERQYPMAALLRIDEERRTQLRTATQKLIKLFTEPDEPDEAGEAPMSARLPSPQRFLDATVQDVLPAPARSDP